MEISRTFMLEYIQTPPLFFLELAIQHQNTPRLIHKIALSLLSSTTR